MNQATEQFFLGRQPILDRNHELVAYELLFRDSSANTANITDGAQATATVIVNAFAELGVEAALGECRGFINVNEEFLFSDLLELLPRQSVVLEILETVPLTPAVIARCASLKAAGFTLAMDDVVSIATESTELLELVDIVKVDIQAITSVQLTRLAGKIGASGKTWLAEKVDTRAQIKQCLELGFSLFQGYYFARPTIIASRKVDHAQTVLMKLMTLLHRDAETAELEDALKAEPGLTVNLLRMTNSVSSGSQIRITSVAHAITVLGRRQLKRWLQLLLFTANKQATERNPLLLLAATRGRLMELEASELQPDDADLADEAFMVGIMSLMPALIGLPIGEIVAPLGLASEVRDALCAGEGRLATLLRIAECSEQGDVDKLQTLLADEPALCIQAINRAQTRALQWANDIARERQG